MEACRILLLSLTLSPLPLCTLVAFARNGSSTEQLKYRSKRNRQDLILPYLRQCGFRVQNHRILKKGDVEITFSSTEEAHRAYQGGSPGEQQLRALPGCRSSAWISVVERRDSLVSFVRTPGVGRMRARRSSHGSATRPRIWDNALCQ